MRIFASTKARTRKIIRWVGNRFVSKAIILLYHRIVEPDNDPQLLCVSPDRFSEHMEIVRRYAHPISLRELVVGLKKGAIPNRAVIVTFDDGYFDNLHNAKPILERFGIPATVFVATNHIRNPEEYYWDELDRILLQPGTLPERLRLHIDGQLHEWQLDHPVYNESAARKYHGWSVAQGENPTIRHQIYRDLCSALQPLGNLAQKQTLAELQRWSGLSQTGRASHRGLKDHEILALQKEGLIEVGAHTMTHPMLSALSIKEQEAEIVGSKAILENILGDSVHNFAYPFGTKHHYSATTIALIRQAGFVSACANYPETIWRDTDLFQIPRILMRNWSGEAFERSFSSLFTL